MQLPHPFLLLSILTTPTLSILLPQTTESDSPLTLSVPTLLGGETRCTIGSRLSRQRPLKPDCANAIRQLRDNGQHGHFHASGVRDQWQLPERRWHQTCAVVVEMKNKEYDDEGSWLQVSMAAGQLNTACVGAGAFTQLQGGYTYTGRTDGIKVTLMYMARNGVGVVGAGNGTVFGGGGNETVDGLVRVE